MMICRHGLRDVQDYAATVWGDSKIILGSAVYVRIHGLSEYIGRAMFFRAIIRPTKTVGSSKSQHALVLFDTFEKMI